MVTSAKEKFWNIPNILSLYRICIFPFILYLVINKNEKLFAAFITISLITDILDGLIARTFNMQTRIGTKLDSWADIGTYVLAFSAIYIFKWQELKHYSVAISIFLCAYFLSYLLMFIKFKELLGLHTYLFKITGYVQGVFIIILFLFKLYPWLLYTACGIGIIACIEEIIIIMIISEPKSNVKGLYWILNE